ncbi:MAG: hypothetical protein RBQ95_02345 [Paracholeplasma sp.]|nr:hypothetical protein [Paracholeplasma sp.]MDY3195676.1 hypothetical protein [Paracholeplasma sp.]
MELIILLITMSSFMTIYLINKSMLYQKNQTGPKIEEYQILITSMIMGSLGYVFAYFMFGFRHEKKRYHYIELGLLGIQCTIVLFLLLK